MRGRAVFGKPEEAVWRPSPEDLRRSRLAQAMKRWGYTSLTELHRASVDRPEWFWKVALDDLGITSAAPWTAVSDESAGRKFPAWFPGARLNIAAHCVDRYAVR